MGYNFKEAFEERHYCQECINAIAVTALMRYRQDHPDETGVATVKVREKQRTVEINAEDTVFYTWEELGYGNAC